MSYARAGEGAAEGTGPGVEREGVGMAEAAKGRRG
jgi:hypothetical protein